MFVGLATSGPRFVSPVHKLFPNSRMACATPWLANAFNSMSKGSAFAPLNR
jgi:hypothetical protein